MNTRFLFVLSAVIAWGSALAAAEYRVTSPDGKLALIVSDEGGLNYRVEVDAKPVVVSSPLGLEFAGGAVLGPAARIANIADTRYDSAWENVFGNRRKVIDRWGELRLTLRQPAAGKTPERTFGFVARAYDDGVAFRYKLPMAPKSDEFTLVRELTEFRFADDYRCWAGGESTSAETNYPEGKLSAIPAVTPDRNRSGQPFRGVLPLLVEAPGAYVAIAEADLLDWAGMFISGTGGPAVRVTLAPRHDGRGAVVGRGSMLSPWRVLMIGRAAADLVGSDLIANLATPSRVGDISWIRPGISAWDAWWTGENPSLPQYTGLLARGDTRSHREYIDFAGEMGWSYQLVDWFWYENMTWCSKNLLAPPNNPSGDFTRAVPAIDLPGLVTHAAGKKVRLWIWAHSLDLKTFGVDRALDYFASLGIAGVKVDFFDSDSQETVQWVVQLLESAARHKLMVDLHGIYKPTGLARTYPNFLTQEGVLGNEYNKLGGNRCDLSHTVTLPFTRGLLGPMDFTPGGFLNRTPATFKITHPAQVMGTRARQLAMTVVYRSPLLVLCDSPANYRGQPGVEFFRGLPTVWDETVVLSAEVGKHIAIARRSGDRWWLAAMNANAPLTLKIPLDFLGKKGGAGWSLREFADGDNPDVPETVVETTRRIEDGTLTLHLQSGGGYAAVIGTDQNPPPPR